MFNFPKIKSYVISPDSKAFIFVLCIIFSFFISKWILQGAWFNHDLVTITAPLEDLYSRLQRSGQSPLWAPELAGGYPLLATGQLGFWYPPHMILRQFLPGVWTLNISMLLHSILAAIGTFIFLKKNNLRRSAMVVGALLIPLGSAFVGKYESINVILPFTYVPVILLFLQIFLAKGKLSFLVYWIASNVLCILVGHPQMAVEIFILEAIFVISFLILNLRHWRRMFFVVGGWLLIIGLTSSYFLPILYNLPNTDRSQGVSGGITELFEFSFTPEAFAGLIIPHPFGHEEEYRGPKNEAELSSYLGPVAIIFAGIGLCTGRKKFPSIWIFSIFVLVIGIVLALGGQSTLYRWLVHAGWRYFNAPARFFLLAHFGLVFLAAIGFHTSVSKISNGYVRIIGTALLAIGIIIPVLWVSWSWYEGTPWHLIKKLPSINILEQQNSFVRTYAKGKLSDIAPNNNFGVMLWDPVCSTCVYRQTFTSPFAAIQGINLKLSRASASGTVTLKLFKKDGTQLQEASLIAQDIVDSEWNTFSFQQLDGMLNQLLYFEITSNMGKIQAPRLLIHTNPNTEEYDPTGALFSCKSNSCRAIEADSHTVDAAFMIVTPQSNTRKGYELPEPYISASYGIGNAQWSGSLSIRNVSNYLKPLDEPGAESAWKDNRTLVNRFPITHAIGLYPPYRHANNLSDFTEITSIPLGNEFIRLYKNNEAFPRVQFIEHVKSTSGSDNQRAIVSTLGPKDESTIVADIDRDIELNSGGTITSIKDERSRITIQTLNTSDGFLVLRDVLLPGWEATVDAQKTPIYLTDALFRGIRVPAGNHEVVFQYRPEWIHVAVFMTVISLCIVAVLGYLSL